MISKKQRTMEVYEQAGAEMRLYKSLGARLATHISQVLSSTALFLLPPIPPSITVFSNESTLHEVAKVLEFQL